MGSSTARLTATRGGTRLHDSALPVHPTHTAALSIGLNVKPRSYARQATKSARIPKPRCGNAHGALPTPTKHPSRTEIQSVLANNQCAPKGKK